MFFQSPLLHINAITGRFICLTSFSSQTQALSSAGHLHCAVSIFHKQIRSRGREREEGSGTREEWERGRERRRTGRAVDGWEESQRRRTGEDATAEMGTTASFSPASHLSPSFFTPLPPSVIHSPSHPSFSTRLPSISLPPCPPTSRAVPSISCSLHPISILPPAFSSLLNLDRIQQTAEREIIG